MSLTKPRSEQVRFKSSRTGDHELDAYLEAAELGDKTLAELLQQLFDVSGNLSLGTFEFRVNSAAAFQFRVGDFVDPEAGWQSSPDTYIFRVRGAWAPNTDYARLDIVENAGGLYLAKDDNNRAVFTASDWVEIPGGTIDLSAYRTAAAQDVIDAAQDTQIASKYDSSNLATQAEAEAGANNTKLTTPLRVKQAIDALGISASVLNYLIVKDYMVVTADTDFDTSLMPPGILLVTELWGGAGGGGQASPGGSEAEGGGGGDYALALWNYVDFGGIYPIKIGAGGAGAPGSSGNGGAGGGYTSFGDLLGADGGNGGDGSDGPGSGGAGAKWVQTSFNHAPLAVIRHNGAPPSAPDEPGADSIFAGAAGGGARNGSGSANPGGYAHYLDESGGSFDYSLGSPRGTAGGLACGGAADIGPDPSHAGGNGYAYIWIMGFAN